MTLEYLRHFRLGEYAIFDFAVSLIGIYLLSPLLSKLFRKLRLDIPKLNWVYLTLPLSIPIHILTGKITPMTENFLNLHDHYLLKALMLGLTIFGIKGIRVIRKKKN